MNVAFLCCDAAELVIYCGLLLGLAIVMTRQAIITFFFGSYHVFFFFLFFFNLMLHRMLPVVGSPAF